MRITERGRDISESAAFVLKSLMQFCSASIHQIYLSGPLPLISFNFRYLTMYIPKVFLKLTLVTALVIFSIKIFDIGVGLFWLNDLVVVKSRIDRVMNLNEHQPYESTLLRASSYEDGVTQKQKDTEFSLRTDANGFIIGSADFEESPLFDEQIDIIFFGGSTTECLYVPEDKRFPYLVSRMMGKGDGQPIRTRNAGVSGNNSLHSLISLVAKGIEIRPKFSIVMHGINDVTHLSKSLSYWKGPRGRIILYDEAVEGNLGADPLIMAKDIFLPNFWTVTRHNLRRLIPARYKDEWHEFRVTSRRKEEVFEKLEANFRASLSSFIAINRSWGIEPILMTQPSRLRVDDQEVRALY